MKKIINSLLFLVFSFSLFGQDTSKDITANMIFIKGGRFEMGSNDGIVDEQPVHTVELDDFYLSKYQVTVRDFEKFIRSSGYQTNADRRNGSYFWNGIAWVFKGGVNWEYSAENKYLADSEKNHPVIHVSWYDAIYYCNWLSKKNALKPVYTINDSLVTANWEANGYRLPTEAEWEYAASNKDKGEKYAGTSTDSLISKYGNFWEQGTDKDGFEFTSPVGSFEPNDLGLYDMSGNVWEWCWDWYDVLYYKESDLENPKGPAKGQHKVQRGGSWKATEHYLQSVFRGYFSPDDGDYSIGFRVAQSKK